MTQALLEKGNTVASHEETIRNMVNDNLGLVGKIANEYAGRGVPRLDLFQEGAIGLIKAAKTYDSTQSSFSTYATKCIQREIKRCVLNHAGMIRVPRHTMEKMCKVLAVRARLQEQSEQVPTAAQLAEYCDLPAEKVEELLQLIPKVCSLDIPVGEDGDDTLQILLENAQAPEPYEALARQELKGILESLLSQLDKRQRQILRLHFGMEDGNRYSQQQIADKLEISKQRVQQLEKQAISKLKTYGADLGLEDFLE